MIAHAWSVMCLRSSIDKDTNNINLFDSIEQLTLTGPYAQIDTADPPMVPFPFEITSLWWRGESGEATTAEARVQVRGPAGDSKTAEIGALDLTSYKRLTTRTQLPGLRYVGPGLYLFDVQVRTSSDEPWRTVTTLPLEVNAPQSSGPTHTDVAMPT